MFNWLKYGDWENAISLLDYQFKRKNDAQYPNRHFNTASFYIMAFQWNETLKDELLQQEFFENYVKTGYLLTDESKVYSVLYPAKKGILKHRKYVFLSLHLRLFYYAVSLHFIRHLPKPLKKKSFQVSYGGQISFKEEKINLKPKSVYYKSHYKHFYTRCIGFVDAIEKKDDEKLPLLKNGYKRCAIKIDLENFYDEISHHTLFSFRNNTMSEKKFPTFLLFQLLTQATQGLPQTCNDLIASRLSSFYLHYFDKKLKGYLQKNHAKNYTVHRYCDDIHIFVDYEESENVKDIALKILQFCKIELYQTYKLRMNTKSLYYDFSDEKERQKYKEGLKTTSFSNEENVEEENKYLREKHFNSWKSDFEKAVEEYLAKDLIKDELSPDTRDKLKLIYQQAFREDLKSDYQNDLKKGQSITYLKYFNSMTPLLKQAYINAQPKLTCFFLECLSPEYLSEAHIETCMDDMTGNNADFTDDTNTLTLFDLVMSIPNIECFTGKLNESDLFKKMKKSSSEYSYETLVFNLEPKKIAYLSLFSVQRRNAEYQQNYAQALSFLNSELCILLAILPFPRKPKDKILEIEYSLDGYEHKTPELHQIRNKRNEIDVSHNRTNFPDINDESERTLSKSDYETLKGKVIHSVQNSMNTFH